MTAEPARALAVEPASGGWPPDLAAECRRRLLMLQRIRRDPAARAAALAHCANDPVDFIGDWVWTYDPRPAATGGMTHLPFVPFPRQAEFIRWVHGRLEAEDDGLCEKGRELGVTWLCVAIAVHLWLFSFGASIGFGSRKEQLVDRHGDMDSIFEKIRYAINHLPREFLPEGFDPAQHMHYMKIINPVNGASITGEAGDNIGRGGRKTLYFKDESAHYERPMKIEMALSQTTNVQIDVSSVAGPGNPFYTKRMTWPGEKIFVFDWRDDPRKGAEWYAAQKAKRPSIVVAQEIDRDYGASVEGVVIPGKWIQAAIALDLPPSGLRTAGFDVADDGSDRNGFYARHGHTALHLREWKARGATEASRDAREMARDHGIEILRYEKEGVGASTSGVAREEASRGKLPRWDGISPGSTYLPGWYVRPSKEDRGKRNEDMFLNLKAMAWWLVRDRFERTWEHVEGIKRHGPDQLISLARIRTLDAFPQLEAELSQPTWQRTAAGKIKIDKKPDGTVSPNLADSCVISYMDGGRRKAGVWGTR